MREANEQPAESYQASQAKIDRYNDDAKHIMVKRVGDTEFRTLDELHARDAAADNDIRVDYEERAAAKAKREALIGETKAGTSLPGLD